MTADGAREQIAEALHAALLSYAAGETDSDVTLFDHYATSLLPVVSRIADQRAAEVLDAMAVAFYADARHLVSTGEEAYRHAADDCRAEAARLASPTEPKEQQA